MRLSPARPFIFGGSTPFLLGQAKRNGVETRSQLTHRYPQSGKPPSLIQDGGLRLFQCVGHELVLFRHFLGKARVYFKLPDGGVTVHRSRR